MGLQEKKSGNYLSILGSDGTIRKTVPENTPGAVKREYETSDKKKGTKYELVYKSLSGLITKVKFREGDYGTQIGVSFSDNGQIYNLGMNVKSRYGMDFMKKLPNVDLSKVVELTPFSFEDNGRKLKGVTLTQDGKKIDNFFFDKDAKKSINGIPSVENWNNLTEDQKTIHMANVRSFLINYVNDFVSTKLKHDIPEKVGANDEIQYPTDDISPEDIPF